MVKNVIHAAIKVIYMVKSAIGILAQRRGLDISEKNFTFANDSSKRQQSHNVQTLNFLKITLINQIYSNTL